MLVDSNLLHELEQNAFSPTGEPMCVFGDPAYPLRVDLQAPYRNSILTPMMEAYKAEMSFVRVTVEWLFGNIINDFKFLDFKKNLKIGMRHCWENVTSLRTPSQCNNVFIWKQHHRIFWAEPSFLGRLLQINHIH